LKKTQICPISYNYKIAEAFSHCKKGKLKELVTVNITKTGVHNLYTFLEAHSIINENLESVLFH
jgi:hypothetical protein